MIKTKQQKNTNSFQWPFVFLFFSNMWDPWLWQDSMIQPAAGRSDFFWRRPALRDV
jgi:hypothetical protein